MDSGSLVGCSNWLAKLVHRSLVTFGDYFVAVLVVDFVVSWWCDFGLVVHGSAGGLWSFPMVDVLPEKERC